MKKFLSAALAAAMAFSLVACGSTPSSTAGSDPASAGTSTAVSYTHLEKTACNQPFLVVYYIGTTHALLCFFVPARVEKHAGNAEEKQFYWRI